MLKKQGIATLKELKDAIGTNVTLTVFRKLTKLGYRTSYSHRGGYYTLRSIPRFNRQGLWSVRSVYFSKYGTLLNTVQAFVSQSETGCFCNELENVLHVEVKNALLKLVHQKRISREKVSGLYLYCASHVATRKKQLWTRQSRLSQPSLLPSLDPCSLSSDDQKAAIVLFVSLLDEKQRRLYAGLESLKIGHGGDKAIADLLGLDVGTVAKGRSQLLQHDVEFDRVRKLGAGRKTVEKKRRKSSRPSNGS